MSKLVKDNQKSQKSEIVEIDSNRLYELASVVYDFLDEVAVFESDEYVIHAEVTHDVIFKVTAESEEDAQSTAEHACDFDDYEESYQSNFRINDVEKSVETARSAVDLSKMKDFLEKLLTLSKELDEQEIA